MQDDDTNRAADDGAIDETEEIPVERTDPSVNDVLAQQMGTEYGQVESPDKEALQKEINDQGTTAEDAQAAAEHDADAGPAGSA